MCSPTAAPVVAAAAAAVSAARFRQQDEGPTTSASAAGWVSQRNAGLLRPLRLLHYCTVLLYSICNRLAIATSSPLTSPQTPSLHTLPTSPAPPTPSPRKRFASTPSLHSSGLSQLLRMPFHFTRLSTFRLPTQPHRPVHTCPTTPVHSLPSPRWAIETSSHRCSPAISAALRAPGSVARAPDQALLLLANSPTLPTHTPDLLQCKKMVGSILVDVCLRSRRSASVNASVMRCFFSPTPLMLQTPKNHPHGMLDADARYRAARCSMPSI